MLQKSVSHYTVDKDGSERLMLKYYEHLLKIKLYLKQTFNLDVLENISDFPLNTDTELLDYYKKSRKELIPQVRIVVLLPIMTGIMCRK